MKSLLKFWIVFVLLITNSIVVYAEHEETCMSLEKDLRAFGPNLVSTGLPFHYNFRFLGEKILEFEVSSVMATFDFSEELNEEKVLRPVAFYSTFLEEQNITFYRLMFRPSSHQPPGFYKARGEIVLSHLDRGHECKIPLIKKEIELVRID